MSCCAEVGAEFGSGFWTQPTIGSDFSLYPILIPAAKSILKDTGLNWEGVNWLD